MSHHEVNVSRSSRRRTVPNQQRFRQRFRLQPTLLALEDRRLLATLLVTSSADPASITANTLRWAVQQANAATSPSSIEIELGTSPATITLLQGQLELSNTANATTIYDGPGEGAVTISGNNASGVFQVDSGVTASISGLTISGGSTSGNGGGVYNAGTLTVNDSAFNSNYAGSEGGGLYNVGSLTVSGSSFSSNFAAGNNGGGIANENGGIATITDSTFTSNSANFDGGGLLNTDGSTATLSGCAFTGNVTDNYNGGGIANENGATLTASDCSFTSNVGASDNGGGGGGMFNDNSATATVSGCTFTDNSDNTNGGGLSNNGGTVTVIGSTFTSNSAGNAGGGLVNYGGNLTLTDCTVSGNSASVGGALADNGSTVTLSGGAVSNNYASSHGAGVYIYNGGTGTLTDCTVSGNSSNGFGGGLLTYGSTATVTDCTFSGNSAVQGGGVDVNNGSLATLTDCTVSDNSAFGGGNSNGGGLEIGNGTTATLNDCTITGNSGLAFGGMNTVFATTTLTGCTISNNSAIAGSSTWNLAGQAGGVSNYGGSTTLINCTISGNSASNDGGGVFSADYGGTTLINCTVYGNTAANQGGGLYLYTNGTATLGNTIVAGNTATIGPDASGSFSSLGNNLIGETDGSSGWVHSDQKGSIATPLNPLLGPLANNGGPTQTMALLTGSPAIDAGDNSLIPAGVTTDQRGYLRIYHVIVDIGAFEWQPPPSSIAVSPSNPTLAEGVAGQFIAMGTYPDGETLDISAEVTWASATPSVATIGGTGVASALALGTSAINASWQGVTSPDDTLTVIAPSFVVNTTADAFGFYSGTTSLREAIAGANVVPGQTITFDPSVFGSAQTITLSLGQLELSDTSGTETITGPAAGLTLSGGGNSRVFQVDGDVTASLSGLTITGGSASNGGGLANYGGTVTLTGCTVSGNSAGHDGGGMYFNDGGTATLTGCTVSSNSAGYSGGGLFEGSSVTLALTNCTVSGNSADNNGGGLANYGGTAILTGCTVSGNSSNGGYGGGGGGVLDTGSATATLINCTVSGNSALHYGGGLTNNGSNLTLTNSTVSGNFAGNKGGGLINVFGGTATLDNTIVAGNTGATNSPDVAGTFHSLGFNLIGNTNGSSGWVRSDLAGTIANPRNPLLAPLGNYGGPTQTMALLPGSPAINAGASGAGIPTTDQRGEPRFGATDIGAFESQGFTLIEVSGSAQSANIGTAFDKAIELIVKANDPLEPVAGGIVYFRAPSSGASATLSSESAEIGQNGMASITAIANEIAGTYEVSANTNGAAGSDGFVLTNTIPPPMNITADLSITYGGFVFNRKTGQFSQTITIKNTSGQAIVGPIEMMLVNLQNGSLVKQRGVTQGNPYITILSTGSLAAGASLTFSLVFADPTLQAITYSAEFLAGPIPPPSN
jgi:fibronectin-binding autotransporter adhesin